MTTLTHSCEECNSSFTIKYDVSKCDDDPIYCPFCSEYILLDSENIPKENVNEEDDD
jgi:predicted  nucleic acid-binding Zn-ribbon protein